MITGIRICEVLMCRFNKDSDCKLKEITINEFGLCAFLDVVEKEQKRTYIESNECDSVELLSAREEWILTQFKFLKQGFTFRMFKNGELVTINDETMFITTSDAYITVLDSNKSGIPIYRVNIYVNS